ncbi:carbamate kinase [Clostridium thermopalmarium]|uniref:Carbamate kinase n=1 Tax=Clostridium thermopalmarium DSM 5974 TaxID=1121340 RepID=A0A2T0ASL4_9CLOT|nr:carbamate kinase [Clostridium thermopalmarium]PRR73174.1 Carbamate kinase 1 [Clostridium thermopalmarium DSM 5974]PVZ25261.1 carbamate kinase [Clostridium thermopalmarium DSM 5974]
MKKRIVIALGGNALGSNLSEQMKAVKTTSKAIVDLIEEGYEVVVAHGNGPQVGMINLAFEAAVRSEVIKDNIPMSVCVAMSQGYIGYDLQNALREEMLNRGLNVPVSSIISQVVVDKNDPAFKNPTKPIGSFYSKKEAEEMIQKGYILKEDAGRGYRRVVASPKPVDIVEKETIKALLNSGQLVIAVGGGGIPVIKDGNHLKGANAVVDKDFASSKLAQLIDADFLVILTAVEKVAINFGKENEMWLDELTIDEAKKYIEQGHFAPGSMLPKIEAAIEFVNSGSNRKALITLLEKAKCGIEGKTGTIIK